MKYILVLDDMEMGVAFTKWLRYEPILAQQIRDLIDLKPDDWSAVQVNRVQDAVGLLMYEIWGDRRWEYILIDNDLGLFDTAPGIRVLDWIEEMVAVGKLPAEIGDRLVANSANPPARQTMHIIIQRIKEMA